ncbi:hypothetical protein F4861DRAFT_334805 [Xylaria intraflava]|nr:hypothetical protein F4861DRAFT_334805 [Xylaria intraflava]
MGDKLQFVGAALPWLRNIDDDGAAEVFRRLDQLSRESNRQRETIMRPNTVQDADGWPRSAAAEPLSRWDTRPPNVIFREGFVPWVAPRDLAEFRAMIQTDSIPFHLHRWANDQPKSFFVSTTRPIREHERNGPVVIWRPPPPPESPPPGSRRLPLSAYYRYEVFVYGGADLVATFTEHQSLEGRSHLRYPDQAEVTFIGGIRPGLIRSATRYSDDSEVPRVTGVWHNLHFDPLLNGIHLRGPLSSLTSRPPLHQPPCWMSVPIPGVMI